MSSEKYVFYSTIIASFIGAFTGSSLNVALPVMGVEFGASADELGFIVSAYFFGSSMLLLPMGRVADIVGQRKIYTIGILCFSVISVILGFGNSVTFLSIGRFFQGCSLALVFGTSMAILVASHKPTERGRILGSSVTAVYTGLSLGPVVGGFICEYLGWRPIFFLTSLLMLISVILISRVKEEWYGGKDSKLDVKGAVCYLMATPLFLYGLTEIDSDLGQKLLVAGVVLLITFIWWQLKASSPLLDIRIFKGNKVFTLSNIASMIHYSATFSIGFMISLYLQSVCSMSPSRAGFFILFQSIMMALISRWAGALSDRISPGKVASAGMAINCACLFAMSTFSEATPLGFVVLLLMLTGLGMGIFSSPNNNAIMGAVTPKEYGTAASVLSTMRTYGQSFSMAFVTILLSYYDVGHVIAGSYGTFLEASEMCYKIMAVLCLAGVLMSLARNK